MDHAPMSPLGMLLNASPVSRLVMIVLLAASVWTWVLILDGLYVVWRLMRALRDSRDGGPTGVLWRIEDAGREASAFVLTNESDREKRRRVFQKLRSAATDLVAEARSGLDNLAIVSSVGPFVGLFGTVWGIMSSFGSIAQTQDTGLAVVAPGIAEALAATAYGLAAAIPAAIGYNRIGFAFSRLDEEMRQYVDVIESSGRFADARDESDATAPAPMSAPAAAEAAS
ncbi:MAG TPA: MotA/TolQ/ExbB proton channel family protein [Methylosinus sp.]|jgi:biopolymer transport protein ExbB/TolQ